MKTIALAFRYLWSRPLQAVLNLHSDEQIKRALAGTLAVPETQIRRSRTALFIYLLKRHAQST